MRLLRSWMAQTGRTARVTRPPGGPEQREGPPPAMAAVDAEDAAGTRDSFRMTLTAASPASEPRSPASSRPV